MSGIDMSFVIGRAAQPGEGAAAKEPADAGRRFRVLVLGDFSGRGSRRADGLDAPTFKPVPVDVDTLDAVIERMAPRVRIALPQAGGAPVEATLRQLDDLSADGLFARLPLLAQLRDLRARLAHPATFEHAAAELRALDREAGRAADGAAPTPAASADAGAAPAGAAPAAEDDASTLARLLGGQMPAAAPAPAPATPTIASTVDCLVRQAMAGQAVPATAHLQQPLIDAVDRSLGDALRAVLRDAHWRGVEGAWLAVDRFVRSVEMDQGVVLELVDASAADLLDSLVAAGGDAAATPLARGLAARRLNEGVGPCAVVVGLYEFGTSAVELGLLAGLGALAAGEGALCLAGAAASLALVDAPPAWSDFGPSPDAGAQARWQALRGSWVAPHVALTWPRLLARLPYGKRSQPVSAFAFEELPGRVAHDELPWRPAPLDAAALLAQAYARDGWEMQPESAVEIDDLPAWTDRSGDDPRFQAVAEVFMSEQQARAVSAAGITPLVSHRGMPQARVAGWRSIALQSPALKGPWSG